jgi:hypothetical protein
MEVSCKLHALAALILRTELPVGIDREAELARLPVWMLYGEKGVSCTCRDCNAVGAGSRNIQAYIFGYGVWFQNVQEQIAIFFLNCGLMAMVNKPLQLGKT